MPIKGVPLHRVHLAGRRQHRRRIVAVIALAVVVGWLGLCIGASF
jgi:hypothetical protein